MQVTWTRATGVDGRRQCVGCMGIAGSAPQHDKQRRDGQDWGWRVCVPEQTSHRKHPELMCTACDCLHRTLLPSKEGMVSSYRLSAFTARQPKQIHSGM
eukprot:11625878-Alexandrium_andersonii.AAC.1